MRPFLLLAIGVMSVMIAGCSGLEIKPGTKPMARREIPPGPGLLTGSKGEFVIYRLEEGSSAKSTTASQAEPAKDGAAAQ